MNIRKILFPTDFSSTGDVALAYATALAEQWGATLHIVHVEESAMAYAGTFYTGMLQPSPAAVRKMLEAVVPDKSTIPYEHHLLMGDPASAIVNYAREHGVDLIVMGTHGRTGLGRLVMGSVAEAVVRGAPCPVVTIKAHAIEPAHA